MFVNSFQQGKLEKGHVVWIIPDIVVTFPKKLPQFFLQQCVKNTEKKEFTFNPTELQNICSSPEISPNFFPLFLRGAAVN